MDVDVPPPSCLGEVCWSNDQVSPVCWGMSLKQFNDFVAACRSTSVWAFACEKGHVNLYDVVTSLVKPWTRNTGCGIALRMNPKEVLKAELMVSHSWSECMDQCSEALSKFCARQKNLEDIAVILWFCAFAQYQSGDDPGDRGPTVAEQLALDPFGSVIRTLTSSGLGMVVIQTSLADVYSRLWCVYEIAEAVDSKAFLPPFKRPRSQLRARNVDSREGREERSEVEAAVTWLKESWEGFNATYSKIWSGEQVSAEDAAPPAEPPDCVSYNTKGACCPSLACYKDLPLGLKIYVTILLLLAMRGGVRMISENPSLSYANAGKCLFVLAVGTQAKVSMAYSQRALETRSGSFEEMLRARTSRASCRDPSDEQMIRQKVQQAGGFSRLDSIIFTFRLQAFQEMMHELHESTRDQLRSEIQKMTGRGGPLAASGTDDVPKYDRLGVTEQGLEQLEDAKYATGSGGVGFILYSICLGPLALVFCILAFPFVILCAPCILFYRHSLKSKTEPAVARIMADDPEAPVAAERRTQRKQRQQGDPAARRREDLGPPAPASYGAGMVAEPDSQSGSEGGESFGDAGEDDELMLKRLEMAKQMAPQLFS
eukprot:s1202_g9.t2